MWLEKQTVVLASSGATIMKVASTDQSGATADEIAPTAAMNSTVVRVELLYIHIPISSNFQF